MPETLSRIPEDHLPPEELGGTHSDEEPTPARPGFSAPEPEAAEVKRPKLSAERHKSGEREDDLGEHIVRPEPLAGHMEVGDLLPGERDTIAGFAARAVKARVQARRVGMGSSRGEAGLTGESGWLDRWRDSRTEYYGTQKETDKALFDIGMKRHEEWRQQEFERNGEYPDPVRDEAHAKLLAYNLVGRYDMAAAELSHDPNEDPRGVGRTLSRTLSEVFMGKEGDSKRTKRLKRLGFGALVAGTTVVASPVAIIGSAGLASGVALSMAAGAAKGAMIGGAIGYMKAQLAKNKVDLSTQRAFNNSTVHAASFLNPERKPESLTDIETKIGAKIEQIKGTATEASHAGEFGPMPQAAEDDISYQALAEIIRAGLLVRSEGLITAGEKGEVTYFKGDIAEIEERQQRAKTIATMGAWAAGLAVSGGLTAGVLNKLGIVGEDSIAEKTKNFFGGFVDDVRSGGNNLTQVEPSIPRSANWNMDSPLGNGYDIDSVRGDTVNVTGPNGEHHVATAHMADINDDGSVTTGELEGYLNYQYGPGAGHGVPTSTETISHTGIGDNGVGGTEAVPVSTEVTPGVTGAEVVNGAHADNLVTETLNSPYGAETDSLQSLLSKALGEEYIGSLNLSNSEIINLQSDLYLLNDQFPNVFQGNVYSAGDLFINTSSPAINNPAFHEAVERVLAENKLSPTRYGLAA